jgi:hypothetical protein
MTLDFEIYELVVLSETNRDDHSSVNSNGFEVAAKGGGVFEGGRLEQNSEQWLSARSV